MRIPIISKPIVSRFLAGLLATTMLLGTSTGQAAAQAAAAPGGLPTQQIKIFNNNVRYFDYFEASVPCGGLYNGDIALVGNDNIEKAFNYFIARGLTPAQSAGIVGNLIAESGVDPTIKQGGGGPGRGIAQWGVGGRWDTTQGPNGLPGNVVAFANSKGGAQPTDLGLQLDFLWHEMSNIPPWTKAMESIRAATTFGQAAVAFLVDFEKAKDSDPNGSNARKRTANAGQVLERYGGVLPGGGGNSPVAGAFDCGAGSTVNCDQAGQVATGKAAILCNARKFDPWGYLWGGGHGDPEQFMKNWDASGGFTQSFRPIVDCSGLITVSLWLTFHVKIVFTTSGMSSVPQFREIPIAQSQPGDFVWRPGHVEIVAAPGATATFGAHTSHAPPERQISDAPKQSWSKAYEYIGAN